MRLHFTYPLPPVFFPTSTYNVEPSSHDIFSILSMTSTSPNFRVILNAALAEYSNKTKKDLRNHPLASEIEACDSAESMLAIFQKQAQEFDDFRNGDPKLIKCLRPFVSDLYALSTSPVIRSIVGGVGLVSPNKFLFFSRSLFECCCPVGVPPCISSLL